MDTIGKDPAILFICVKRWRFFACKVGFSLQDRTKFGTDGFFRQTKHAKAVLASNPGPHHLDLLDLREEGPLRDGRRSGADEGLGSRLKQYTNCSLYSHHGDQFNVTINAAAYYYKLKQNRGGTSLQKIVSKHERLTQPRLS